MTAPSDPGSVGECEATSEESFVPTEDTSFKVASTEPPNTHAHKRARAHKRTHAELTDA